MPSTILAEERMFTIAVTREFCAAHAIVIAGVREPLHGHNFRVTATLEGPTLDAEGLLCDFHVVERELDAIIAPWHNRNLQESPAFATLNPSAEVVAMVIGQSLARAIKGRVPTSVRVASVSVTEAPGCIATWLA
jgi:6-pyruvoyltetrahydropterin/6-carboxytetrahydropterin synthase